MLGAMISGDRLYKTEEKVRKTEKKKKEWVEIRNFAFRILIIQFFMKMKIG